MNQSVSIFSAVVPSLLATAERDNDVESVQPHVGVVEDCEIAGETGGDICVSTSWSASWSGSGEPAGDGALDCFDGLIGRRTGWVDIAFSSQVTSVMFLPIAVAQMVSLL